MSTVGNVMILASAGSGKTYALTNRFVRLLALGAEPDRIAALTFTRKAAGEFFDEILKKLARAATESDYAKQLASEIEVPRLGTSDFLKMLRAVVTAMPRLRLGTFDGFFARIARNFPLELGLSGEFEILQEYAARAERGRVLRKMFERTGELDDAQKEFIEAFKRATFGVDEKQLGAQLDAFLDQHQEIFLTAPDREYWGEATRIWPDGGQWLDGSKGAAESIKTLQDWVKTTPIGEKQRARWNEFLDSWSAWTPGATPDRALAYVLEKALAMWKEVESGCAVLEFDRKKQELTPAACRALADLTRQVVATEIARRMEMTRGIHAVLQGYEAVYHNAVRRAGKLTFGDVQRLLVPGEDGAAVLSQKMDTEGRMFIDYRLDAEIDHWLLDEFQDTSFGQWSVLRNLVDEALQDPTRARSFFYVGDVKQAIFAWRDGDPRLFREIFDQYNAAQPGLIAEEHLVKSWRSGPVVVGAVNQVFGDSAVLSELFPGTASEAWNREWRAHESAKPQLTGQVALLHADDEAGRFAVALSLLQEIDPLARGLTCALLVQSNQMAARLADYLRREGGFPAVAESDLHICIDNPLGSALLALAKAAAHPGDTLAAEHLRMTPLGDLLATDGLNTPEKLTRTVLAQVHAQGFERSMAFWIRRLVKNLPADDEFSRERGRQFTAAARLFDETGSRQIAEFIEFMERHTVRDLDAAAALRVMTIHKAKGLGFDVVLLPDLEGNKLDCRRDGLAVQRAADRAVEWILDLPPKLFHLQDAVLSSHVQSAEADACYESLSLLYVAMTRAKRALYLITKPTGTSTSRNFPRLLASTLGEETQPITIGGRTFGGAFGAGECEWFRGLEAPLPKALNTKIERLEEGGLRRAPRLLARRPSAESHSELRGRHLFSVHGSRAAETGNEVHRLLAEVEWGEAEDFVAKWKAWSVSEDALAQASACLESAALKEVWRKRPSAEVWRERAFEVVVDGTWITGVFDRVIVEFDSGRVARVIVIDFKTDQIKSGAESAAAVARYTPQLNHYRRVGRILTGVMDEQIECLLVFTRSQHVVRIEPPLPPV